MTASRQPAESAWGGFLLSLGLHAALGALIVYGAMVFPGILLGGARAGGVAPSIQAGLVSRLPGASIPLPPQTSRPTQNRLATDTPALGVGRPHREIAPRDAVPLPDRLRTLEMQRQQLALDRDRIAASDARPSDRVPVGGGGAVSGSFGATRGGAAPGAGSGMTIGDAAFGAQYAAWLNALRDRLAFYFHQQLQPAGSSGDLVTVSFRVSHDGLVQRVNLVRSSGFAAVDRMGLQAVQQMAAHETDPLPATYSKGFLDITVTFELP